MQNLSVLQVCPHKVHPPDSGGDYRKDGLMASFVDAGDQVTRFSQRKPFNDYRSGIKEFKIEDNYREILNNCPIHEVSRMATIFGFNSSPLVGKTLSIRFPSTLEELINEADIVFVEGPWQVEAIANHSKSTPVVYSSHNVEYEMYKSMGNLWQNSPFIQYIRSIEETAIKKSNLVVATSERDRDLLLNEYGNKTEIFVAPNGVHKEKTEDNIQNIDTSDIFPNVPDDCLLSIFVGSSREPNTEAVRQIENIFDGLGGTNIYAAIIGQCSKAVSVDNPNVIEVGYVDELSPYLQVADVGLNPMISGAGTNIKMFDYLSHGLTVISTPFGCRGLDLQPNRDVLIAEVDRFEEQLRSIYNSQDEYTSIGESGRTQVRERYTWESISAQLRDHLCQSCLK